MKIPMVIVRQCIPEVKGTILLHMSVMQLKFTNWVAGFPRESPTNNEFQRASN